jgi:integrase
VLSGRRLDQPGQCYAHRVVEIGANTRSRKTPRFSNGTPSTAAQTAEVARLIDAATGRSKVLLMMAAFTGLRASELRGLPWRNVNLKTGEISVTQRADHWDAIGKPKSKSSRRTVPIGPELVSELRRWKVACPISPLDLVFPTSVGTVDHQNMRRGLWVVMVKVAW